MRLFLLKDRLMDWRKCYDCKVNIIKIVVYLAPLMARTTQGLQQRWKWRHLFWYICVSTQKLSTFWIFPRFEADHNIYIYIIIIISDLQQFLITYRRVIAICSNDVCRFCVLSPTPSPLDFGTLVCPAHKRGPNSSNSELRDLWFLV